MQEREYIEQLLTAPDQLSAMDKGTLKRIFGSEVARMRGYDQNNPHHCYDLLTHTVKTIEGLACFCRDQAALPLLRVAALLHDVGKPQVMRMKEGRSVYYGHAERSAQIARPLLSAMGYTAEETARILFFVTHHDAFIGFKLPEELRGVQNTGVQTINVQSVTKLLGRIFTKQRGAGFSPTKADFIDLLALSAADASAQSERAVIRGKTVDTRAQKLRRNQAILQIVNGIEKV